VHKTKNWYKNIIFF